MANSELMPMLGSVSASMIDPRRLIAALDRSIDPMFSTIAPADESLIAAAFKTNGGTITATLQTATPPAGGLPMARSSVYSFRQGPRDAGASGPTTVRTAAMGGTVAADGKTATIPYGGKPDGASATSYAEFGLIHTDRNGREMVYTLQYR